MGAVESEPAEGTEGNCVTLVYCPGVLYLSDSVSGRVYSRRHLREEHGVASSVHRHLESAGDTELSHQLPVDVHLRQEVPVSVEGHFSVQEDSSVAQHQGTLRLGTKYP